MGAFDQQEDTITIHAKSWDPHEQVVARATVTLADEEWVNNQVLKMKQGKGKGKQGIDIDSQLGATRRLWIERMVTSWTFTKNGQPVPISRQAISALPSRYADYIYQQINDANEEDDEEEENDFLPGAEHTTAAPVVEMKGKNYLSKL